MGRSVYEVLAALRKAPPPDPNATPQQYENALKDLEGKWEEELEKNAEFSDIEAFAKIKEALDQILKVDLSKLDSAEMRALNDAFVKILENEKKCMEKRCGHNATNDRYVTHHLGLLCKQHTKIIKILMENDRF